jgi:hypothetical protein
MCLLASGVQGACEVVYNQVRPVKSGMVIQEVVSNCPGEAG